MTQILLNLLAIAGFAGSVIVYFRDRARWMTALAEERHQARTDVLTGLLNRRGLMAELDRWVHDGRTWSLVIIDADRFKLVNDTYGHEIGDEVLIGVARILRSRGFTDAVVGRLGGDEFAVALAHSPRSAADLMRRTASAVVVPIPTAQTTVTVRLSAGIARHEPGIALGELLRRADSALYSAKLSVSRVAVWSDEPVRWYDPAADLRLRPVGALAAMGFFGGAR